MKWYKVAFTLIVLIACVLFVIDKYRLKQVAFESLDQFSEAWKSSPTTDRPKLLKYILNEAPSPHATFGKTKLHGLSVDEVEKILGKPTVDFANGREKRYSFEIGKIPVPMYRFPLFFGDLMEWFGAPYHRRDILVIEFDDNDSVVNVSSGS